jgi:hypothetical protein
MPNTVAKDLVQVETGKLPRLRFLRPEQLTMIDEALGGLGEYGEVRLVVEKGRLRFIVTQKSYDVMKWSHENRHSEKMEG